MYTSPVWRTRAGLRKGKRASERDERGSDKHWAMQLESAGAEEEEEKKVQEEPLPTFLLAVVNFLADAGPRTHSPLTRIWSDVHRRRGATLRGGPDAGKKDQGEGKAEQLPPSRHSYRPRIPPRHTLPVWLSARTRRRWPLAVFRYPDILRALTLCVRIDTKLTSPLPVSSAAASCQFLSTSVCTRAAGIGEYSGWREGSSAGGVCGEEGAGWRTAEMGAGHVSSSATRSLRLNSDTDTAMEHTRGLREAHRRRAEVAGSVSIVAGLDSRAAPRIHCSLTPLWLRRSARPDGSSLGGGHLGREQMGFGASRATTSRLPLDPDSQPTSAPRIDLILECDILASSITAAAYYSPLPPLRASDSQTIAHHYLLSSEPAALLPVRAPGCLTSSSWRGMLALRTYTRMGRLGRMCGLMLEEDTENARGGVCVVSDGLPSATSSSPQRPLGSLRPQVAWRPNDGMELATSLSPVPPSRQPRFPRHEDGRARAHAGLARVCGPPLEEGAVAVGCLMSIRSESDTENARGGVCVVSDGLPSATSSSPQRPMARSILQAQSGAEAERRHVSLLDGWGYIDVSANGLGYDVPSRPTFSSAPHTTPSFSTASRRLVRGRGEFVEAFAERTSPPPSLWVTYSPDFGGMAPCGLGGAHEYVGDVVAASNALIPIRSQPTAVARVLPVRSLRLASRAHFSLHGGMDGGLRT
ncbi:hypothetical protein B0H17DRAFT_1211392 [Mycena rosella]|uniref:Uncharacterized protein n=1 Tax=Mycena rosella TaxID=1033263 RepID=A0AAD7CY77_MYCRO|nr:hypothetical protein B0H17DRAFT_1211392 [Mycena rosella]